MPTLEPECNSSPTLITLIYDFDLPSGSAQKKQPPAQEKAPWAADTSLSHLVTFPSWPFETIQKGAWKINSTYVWSIPAGLRMRRGIQMLLRGCIQKVDRNEYWVYVSPPKQHLWLLSFNITDLIMLSTYLLLFLHLESSVLKTVAEYCRRRIGNQHMGRQQWL